MVHVGWCKTKCPQHRLPVHPTQPTLARVGAGRRDVTRVPGSLSASASMPLRTGDLDDHVSTPWGIRGPRADGGCRCKQDLRFFKIDSGRVWGGRLVFCPPRGSAFDLRCRARCSFNPEHVAQVIRRRRVSNSATEMVSHRSASAMKVRNFASISGGTSNVSFASRAITVTKLRRETKPGRG